MNNFAQKLLGEMLSRYRDEPSDAGEERELEIRFKDISREAFEDIYKHMSTSPEFANPKLECTVNVISENVYEHVGKGDRISYIRKMTFNKGVMETDEYLQKSRIMRPVQIADYISYSVGLSNEAPCKKFPTNINAIVRFKNRVSFDYIGTPAHPANWRFDITAIKCGILSELASSIKTIKNELFTPALSHDNFIRELNHDMIDSYEVEIEHIGLSRDLTPDDISIAKKIFSMINPQYVLEIAYQDEIYHMAQYIMANQNAVYLFKQPTHRLKQLGNAVYALSKNNYYSEIYPPEGYYATDKADGRRALVSINGNRCRIVLSESMLEFHTSQPFTPGEITIADAELIWDDTSETIFTLYVFEALVCRGENLARTGFEIRVQRLDDVTKVINDALASSGNRAVAKKYIRLTTADLEKQFTEIWHAEYPYTLDGLIITAPGETYSSTKNYKWKPYEHNTIDFLAMKCPQKLLGVKPYVVQPDKNLYLLFVGISQKVRETLGMGFIPHYRTLFPQTTGNYYPIQFSPSANPLAYIYYHDKNVDLDRKIVELARDKENTNWVFNKLRLDRKLERSYFGNDFRVAELTYLNYIDLFNFDDLWKPSNAYFTKYASNMYTGSNKFKRFVISMLLKDNLSGSKWVIDEAAGRGADLHRYQEIGVENALFIEIDPTAIAELIRRKFAFFAVKKRFVRNKTGGVETVVAYDRIHDIEYDKLIVKDVKSLTIHTLVADLKSPAKDLIASTFQYGLNTGLADGIVCNFALHYMCDTLEHLRNLLIFNATMLKIGGVFIFTVMDGKSIFDLLSKTPTGKSWESRENDKLKYAIRKDYAGDKISPVGQMISVLLPFSDELYQEPLCNVDAVIAEAGKLGFKVELNASMDTFMDKFYRADRALFDRLTLDDKHYIALHKFVSLRLVKRVKGM